MVDEKQPEPASLSKAAQTIILQKTVAGRQSPGDWINLFRELSDFDQHLDALRNKLGASGKTAAIVAAISFFAAFFTFGLALLVFIPALIIAIRKYSRKSKLARVDLDNDFRSTLLPFLKIMSEDLSPDKPVDLALDLAGRTDKKMIKKAELPPGRFKKVTQTVWTDPWCRLSGSLVDGSKISLTITNHFTSQERQWRNARGKSKSKTKWKKISIVTAGLRPDPEQFQMAQSSGQAQAGKLKIVDRGNGKIVRLTNKVRFTSVGEPPDQAVSAQTIVGMFMRLQSDMMPLGARR